MKFVNGLVITVPVMTLSQVSATHKDAVCSLDKTIHQKHSVYTPRAHHPDHTDMGRILKTRHPSRISRRIAAPVAQEAKNARMKRLPSHPFSYFSFVILLIAWLTTFAKGMYLGHDLIIRETAHVNGS
jgi:hypothetical protein